MDVRMVDCAVYLLTNDAPGTVKTLTLCLAVELGKGPTLDINYLPESIKDLLRRHNPKLFDRLNEDRKELRSRAARKAVVVQEDNASSHEASEDGGFASDDAYASDGNSSVDAPAPALEEEVVEDPSEAAPEALFMEAVQTSDDVHDWKDFFAEYLRKLTM